MTQPPSSLPPLPKTFILCALDKDPGSRMRQGQASLLPQRSAALKMAEAKSLATTLGVVILGEETVTLKEHRPSTLLGKGKVEEIGHRIQASEAELVIVDYRLSPIQQRNLEKAWNCKVIDRTAMIIEIFASRARSREGKLQVELAALEYQRSRLVRAWTHLERQRGGLGNIGGPGETQIESDRRMIGNDIRRIKAELEEVRRTRGLHRAARKKVPYPIVALVGYTNAGKSTLFNRLTGADVLAEDKLFATLDPTMRLVTLPSKQTIILSDTVGFISDLPTQLIAAFRATLEEVLEADLLLHVQDISDPAVEMQRLDVEKVLTDLGIGDKLQEQTIEVMNKIDALEPDALPHPALRQSVGPSIGQPIGISALSGAGCTALLEAIDAYFQQDKIRTTLRIPFGNGKELAWIHNYSEVLNHHEEEGMTCLNIRISADKLQQYRELFKKDSPEEIT